MKRAGRKLLVLILGVPILTVGIILIPLPGPGILVSLLGFFILSGEFEWAARHFQRFKAEAQKIVDQAKNKHKPPK